MTAMNKIPTFYFPQPLAFRWFVPLESLEFQVNLDVEEQHINAQKQSEKYRGGSVLWKGLEVAVVPQLGFSTVRFLLGYIGKKNAPLLDMVERTLLASGAKASQDAPSTRCKKLYTLPFEIPKDAFSSLDTDTSFITDLELPWYCRDLRGFSSPVDYIGTIKVRRIFIDVYSGPALDVSTNTGFYYIALDYKTSLFRNQNLYDAPIEDIEDTLVKLGATSLEFIQSN